MTLYYVMVRPAGKNLLNYKLVSSHRTLEQARVSYGWRTATKGKTFAGRIKIVKVMEP